MTRAKKAPAGANIERGEDVLTLAGKPYRLRPSHTALQAIEQETDRSILELVRLGDTGRLKLDQLGLIGAELIRAGADAKDEMTLGVSAERIEELILEEGLPSATATFTFILLDAAMGGRKVSGERKAAPASPTSEDAGAA